MTGAEPATEAPRKFVRITGERGGMVEFEYAVGDMALVLELLLPPAAFDDFCKANAVELVTNEREMPADEGERAMAWRPSDVQGSA